MSKKDYLAMIVAKKDILKEIGELHDEQVSPLEAQRIEHKALVSDYMLQCNYSESDAIEAANSVLGI